MNLPTPFSTTNLRIISLGGFGKVTSNMYVYEYANDIILVDCGMGFPTEDMLGVDILIPDISYLKTKMQNIRGMVLTHGHEDHTGALAYILPQLPSIPVYASNLTANLVMDKLADYANMPKQVNILPTGQPLQLGKFTVESVHISHSIPDATNLIITTPVGTIYHGSDFKFDFTPLNSPLPDVGRIAAAGNKGITLLLSDSLGSERAGYTPSERTLTETFSKEVASCQGKFIVSTMSSNISRWQQAADAAVKAGRKIAIMGRSIDRNLKVASRLKYFNIPQNAFIDLRNVKKMNPKQVCILAAGSQAQPGSALERLGNNESKDVQILPGDKVIFSSDYIPGNETAVQTLIDSLSRMGATIIYSGIQDHLHVSGHGSQQDLLLLMTLTRPKFLLPIGGTYRHMVQYSNLAQAAGYLPKQILLPGLTQSIEVTPDSVRIGPSVEVKNIMVDGLGVGDVGNVVLRDRKLLAEEGVVVAVMEVDQNNLSQTIKIEIMSRGFVFDKENTQLLNLATAQLQKIIDTKKDHVESERHLRQIVVDTLEKFFFDQTRRRPMILPVVVLV